ncbi:MAG: apolipoprotein N-acyltransferase [Chloracidobacterium sp.]|nr:apolipoprotein N-acyltransferase [Chloracidobacterium sp.]
MAIAGLRRIIPAWQNALLALVAAGLLILAFPDFEWWWTAWFALVPLMWAVERQKESVTACFLLGWLFGTAFFFGTCWWLTYAPIHYAAVPWPIAYLLILIACLGAGVFPGIFAAILSILLRRFGSWAFLAAPFVWVFTEFLRYWATGNNWNAVGYSQAFTASRLLSLGSVGGNAMISFVVVATLPFLQLVLLGIVGVGRRFRQNSGLTPDKRETLTSPIPTSEGIYAMVAFTIFLTSTLLLALFLFSPPLAERRGSGTSNVVALQPNVPMSGMDSIKSDQFRNRHVALAEDEIKKLPTADRQLPTLVILPESPMNFMYNDDREFQQFVRDFTTRNDMSLLFNSAEPDATNGKYFNSAVMVGPDGNEVAQYDKIYLLPFGEAVPQPFEGIVPGFVGNFSYGREYDLLPLGDAKAGVMICFESHFGQLSREYVRNGADAIIEMTNDGYLGPTPVLRQHLANAVFRAVETNRPVIRVTNVGITAYIDEKGTVLDPLPVYQEGTRTWTVSKSDGSQTFYVKYGDWFAWLCSVVTLGLLIFGFPTRRSESPNGDKY